MSAETFHNLENAIAAHIADETDCLTGAWVVVAETTTLEEMDEEVSSFFFATRDGQSRFMSTGLLWEALEGRE